MPESNEIMSVEGQLVGMPLAGPESFTAQQLDYLKRALGVDETVLFQTTDADGTVGDIQLSEPITNFTQIEFTYTTMPTCCGAFVERFDAATVASYNLFLNGITLDGTTGQTIVFRNKRYTINNDKDKFTIYTGSQVYYNGTAWTKAQNNNYVRVFKVVGIRRVAGGN